MSRRLLPMLVACGVTVSACGGGHQRAAVPSGQVLFSQACGACHTLTGHTDPRHQGGDLRDFHSSRTQLLQLAAEMPVRRPLNRRQLDAVVRFVSAVEAGPS